MRAIKIGAGLGVTLAGYAFLAILWAAPAGAAITTTCNVSLPTDKGRAIATVTVEQEGQYTLWLRMLATAADRNSIVVQVDNQCPVTASSTPQADFRWASNHANDKAEPIRYNLNAGKHTIVLAGLETGTGVDKILLANDPTCVPIKFGENCLARAEIPSGSTPQQESVPSATSRPLNWWVIGAGVIATLAALAFLVWRYLRFAKKTAEPHSLAPGMVVGGTLPAGTRLRDKLVHFWHHDKLVIFICGAIMAAAIITGIAFAAEGKAESEAEAAALSGGAKVAQSQQASGGKYVVFEPNPPGTTVTPVPSGPNNAGGGTDQGSGSTGNNQGGNSNNGGNNGGGGNSDPDPDPDPDPTPAGECPAFPAFPDDNCTGWQHTGVTLQTCVEGDGDEGDGHLEVPNATYDGCDFTNGAVVHSTNVTIKRSRIQGVVSAHWSTDYDFQNLTMIDVEIIAATPEQIAAKNMVNNSGGSAMNGANVTCIRCRIHYVPTGISLGNGSTIKDSYVSDVTWGPGAHQAAIGAGGNSGHNSAIIHNRLDCSRWNVNAPGFQQGCSSALSLYDEPTLNNVLVQNNLFDTAGGYCTYGGGPQGTNIRYIDNRFGKKYYGSCGSFGAVSAFYSSNSGNIWNGNNWLDGSGALSP